MGLDKKEYHITLSEDDDHNQSKGIGSLLGNTSREDLVATICELGEEGIDHAIVGARREVDLVRAFMASMMNRTELKGNSNVNSLSDSLSSILPPSEATYAWPTTLSTPKSPYLLWLKQLLSILYSWKAF